MEWTQDMIKSLLKERDDAVERAIIALFNLQNDDEKYNGTTCHLNGVGYNRFDSGYFTNLANKLLRKEHLTTTEIAISRCKLMKYSKQLSTLANNNIKGASL